MSLIMIRLSVVVILGFVQANGFAQSKAPRTRDDRSSQHWRVLLNDDGKDIKSSSLVLQRYVHLLGTVIPVSTLTHSVIERENVLSEADGRKEARQIADGIRATLKSPAWKVKCRNSQLSCEFTADWPAKNRILHMVYRNLGSKFAYSISTTRRVYGLPVLSEAKVLQSALAQSERVKVASVWDSLKYRVFAFLWPEEARAATPGLSSVTFSMPGYKDITVTGDVNTIKTAFSQMVDKAKGAGFSLVETGNNFVNNVAGQANSVVNNAGGQANGVINNAVSGSKDVLNQAGQVGNDLVSNTEAAGHRLMAHAMELEQQTARDANALLKRATSFKNVLKTSFAAGLGAGFGAATANLVLDFAADGFVYGTSTIYHALMGTLTEADKEMMRGVAGQAFTDLEQAAEQLTRIEIEIDKRIAVLGIASNTPGGDMAAEFSEAIELQGSKYRVYQAELDALTRSNPNSARTQRCAAERAQIAEIGGALNLARKMMVGDERTPEGMCAKINSLFRQWAAAEAHLNIAREALSRNAAGIIDQITSPLIDARNDIGSERKKGNFCKQGAERLADMAADMGPSHICIAKKYKRDGYKLDPGFERFEKYEKEVADQCLREAQAEMLGSSSNMYESCDRFRVAYSQMDQTAALRNTMLLVDANVEAASDLLMEISRKDCEQGVVTGNCDGAAGSFAKMRARYERLYEAASKKCKMAIRRPRAYDNATREAVDTIVAPVQRPIAQVKEERSTVGKFFSALWPGNWFG